MGTNKKKTVLMVPIKIAKVGYHFMQIKLTQKSIFKKPVMVNLEPRHNSFGVTESTDQKCID
jgi:hypothetical protein